MSNVYQTPEALKSKALISEDEYHQMYKQSVEDPDGFWGEQAGKFLTWDKPWSKVKNTDLNSGEIKWFEGGQLNVSANCLDRHLAERGDQVAIIWEGDDPWLSRKITYKELHAEVCQFANALKARGVKQGDRICIYMPMIPEAAVAMLASARLGAIHSVVFGGFSPEALKDRILDSDCETVITADQGIRGGKTVPLKINCDKAVAHCPNVKNVFVVKRTGADIAWDNDHDIWYHQAIATQSTDCPAQAFDAENPLFILYTSGSTGKPKGVLHTSAGYLLYTSITHKYVFNIEPGDVYWCTADVGWITGHSYILYGPLANGATTVMFEGVPTYPSVSRCWDIVDKYDINIFYTAPTAIRALMAHGDAPVEKSSRASLKILGTVGEPINPEAWEWYHRVVGERRCPIVDTWWQTETGGFMITGFAAHTPMKPGSASRPFFGIQPQLMDEQGQIIEGEGEGNLCIGDAWPSMMRTVYGDHKRFMETYLLPYAGTYFTGDGAKRDADGYYWITGRVDDVLNVSGHRLGTAEVESALVLDEDVAEAAVVGYPHDIKGQGIYAYVIPMAGVDVTDEVKNRLVKLVRSEIGPIASPDIIQFTSGLPKTRSGKIMRRILRKIAGGETENLGDISTLADPSVPAELIKGKVQ